MAAVQLAEQAECREALRRKTGGLEDQADKLRRENEAVSSVPA